MIPAISFYQALKHEKLPVEGVWDDRVEFSRLLTRDEGAVYRNIRKRLRQPLSSQQRRVLSMAAEGMANKRIALMLNISTQTVKNHFYNIYRRLGAKDRASAVAIAFRQRLLDRL